MSLDMLRWSVFQFCSGMKLRFFSKFISWKTREGTPPDLANSSHHWVVGYSRINLSSFLSWETFADRSLIESWFAPPEPFLCWQFVDFLNKSKKTNWKNPWPVFLESTYPRGVQGGFGFLYWSAGDLTNSIRSRWCNFLLGEHFARCAQLTIAWLLRVAWGF